MGKIWMPKEQKKPDQRPILNFIFECTRKSEVLEFLEYAESKGGDVRGVLRALHYNGHGQIMGDLWLVVYQARELLDMEVKC